MWPTIRLALTGDLCLHQFMACYAF